jgi:predicted nucleic acid-binding protein
MTVLVDTSIWSLALRRNREVASRETEELAELVRKGRAAIIGPVRQELLAGIKTKEQLEIVRERLRAFPDMLLVAADFELAAEFFNQCRAQGVQGSNTDFLICAAAARRKQAVFTSDGDFLSFAKIIPVTLHVAKAKKDAGSD